MHRSDNRFLKRLPLALALSVFTAASAWGAGNATASLTKRVDRLSAQVQALQATVKKLEQQIQTQQHGPAVKTAEPMAAAPPAIRPTGSATGTAPTTATPTTPPPAFAQAPAQSLGVAKSRWANLKKGMTAKQVHALLGKPSQAMMLNGKKVWYYHYPSVGGGSIMFGADDTVAAWQHPPWTWW